jgi:hypothetical protein
MRVRGLKVNVNVRVRVRVRVRLRIVSGYMQDKATRQGISG